MKQQIKNHSQSKTEVSMKQQMRSQKLEKIIAKYSAKEHNENNYIVGGGLNDNKFASNRHEDACEDTGKLTFGKVCQLFKKATGEDLDFVKEIINYAVPNMEWHHAGQLPKNYGGGMKKTYFLNSTEIVDIATNWNNYYEQLELSKNEERIIESEKKNLEAKKQEFLKNNAKKVERLSEQPEFFYETEREMDGKYGWFSSYGKSYNLPEYYTGWKFESKEKLEQFYKI